MEVRRMEREYFTFEDEHNFKCDIIDVIRRYDIPAHRFSDVMNEIVADVLDGVHINDSSMPKDDKFTTIPRRIDM
jgi:hypothetical protein